jgi:hypothetical protein
MPFAARRMQAMRAHSAPSLSAIVCRIVFAVVLAVTVTVTIARMSVLKNPKDQE